jgi:hypothetical protein
MRARARFVGLLMVIVLLVAVVAAQGPAVYIVTLDDNGNSYYLNSTGDGTLEPQVQIDKMGTRFQYGVGMGYFTDDVNDEKYYDFVVGSGYTNGPSKEIYLYEKKNSGADVPKKLMDPIGTWSSGYYPAAMPVANFDGKVFDGNGLDDFVMVRTDTPDVGLYLNKGDVGFEHVEPELTTAAPVSSFGADAADIDHDGNADFVVAQWTKNGDFPPYSISVNLGNGEGSFTTTSIPTATPYRGITAADFDGDYKVDLIAVVSDDENSPNYPTGANGLDFYNGDGTGKFTYAKQFGLNLISPISMVDNYDLDGDGDQDIVISHLNDDKYGVIVGLNDGSGSFTFGNIISGAQTGARTAISAPPVFPNEAPYADFSVTPALPDDNNRIAAGTTLAFSGADSEDPEGMPMEFSWKFADDDTLVLTQDASHQFITPGEWDVNLTVTDNYGETGETATKTVTIDVNHPPVANDDWYDTVYKTPLTISATLGVLANDTDADGDPFTEVSVVDGPASGSLTLNADGSFTYDPYDDFTGPEDSFTYKVNDDLNDSNVATVTLNFNEPQKWKVDIVPGTINLKSRGVFIAFITLPQTYNANAVQKETVVCEGAPAIRLIRHAKFPQVFGAIFRTADLNKDLKVRHKVEFTVTGKVEFDGQFLDFSGSDTVRVSNPKTKIKDETERFEKQGDKKLFDDYFKGHKDHKDNNDKNDDNDDI